jgi:DNA-binding IclR family transcriptional regulator
MTQSELSRVSAASASDGAGVPAVVRTIDILEYLAGTGNTPATATEIAKATGINVSTCFNILRTLSTARYILFEPRSKTYELGISLRILADSIDRNDQVNRLARQEAQKFARDNQLTTMLFCWTSDGDFEVTDKAEANRKFRITTSIGQRFPWDAAILAKAYFAWHGEQLLDQLIANMPLVPRAPNTITNPSRFRRELAAVRRRGYATSVGEYQPDLNAVAAPIFDCDGQVCVILVASGFAFEFHPEVMKEVGPKLLRSAIDLTQAIGGQYPELDR